VCVQQGGLSSDSTKRISIFKMLRETEGGEEKEEEISDPTSKIILSRLDGYRILYHKIEIFSRPDGYRILYQRIIPEALQTGRGQITAQPITTARNKICRLGQRETQAQTGLVLDLIPGLVRELRPHATPSDDLQSK
jgi:hypothetical protein